MAAAGSDNIAYITDGTQSRAQVVNNNSPKDSNSTPTKAVRDRDSDIEVLASNLNSFIAGKKTKTLEFETFSNWQDKKEKEYHDLQRTWFSVWNKQCLLISAYFTSVVLFIIFFHVETLPAMPYPMSGNLADWDPDYKPYIWWSQGPVLVEIMWGFIHLRKTVLIIVSALRHQAATTHIQLHMMQDIQTDCMGMPRCLSACVIGYHVVIGIWLGWANNVFSGYLISDVELIISGYCLYVLAELVIISGTGYYLYKKQTESRLFRRLRLAAEVLSWTGFGLVSLTLPAVLVFLMRFALLVFFLIIPDRPYCCR